MGYGFVDQGILSSKLVQDRTAPKLCYRQHDVEAELHIYLSMSDQKIPQSVMRTILVKDLGSTHTSGELGSTMNTAFLKNELQEFWDGLPHTLPHCNR